ncbi:MULTISPECIES: hypothetical protein [unclassified Streptomyces]|uniref:hypothetical protein n=1 Tax=unclassified Streptomyces TaxID=2593676 RepID=UPI0038633648|nr:hypothetical protein OG569_36770 [Streptomyces sp. NBC_00827]
MALHNLADSQSFGQVLTSVQVAALGDIDDDLAQLERHQELLTSRPGSAGTRRCRVWADHPADRLMPLLDALATITGSFLPLQVPSTT